MKLFDLLQTMNPEALTSIEVEGFTEPLLFGEVKKLQFRSDVGAYEVDRIYPEYYKGRLQTGITVLVKTRG